MPPFNAIAIDLGRNNQPWVRQGPDRFRPVWFHKNPSVASCHALNGLLDRSAVLC